MSNTKKTEGDVGSGFEKKDFEVINISSFPTNEIKFDEAKKIILLPNYDGSKGERVLPPGCVAIFDRTKHCASPDILGSDPGCGILVAKINFPLEDLEHLTYTMASEFELNPEARLNTGHHFMNIYQVKESITREIVPKELIVLIHANKEGRMKALDVLNRYVSAGARLISDEPHNFFEFVNDKVVYRRGAIKLECGEIGFIPASITDEALVVRAKPSIKDLENSICAFTGEIESREKQSMHLEDIRKKVYIPHFLMDWLEGRHNPDKYRKPDDLVELIKNYVDVVGKLTPKSAIF